MVHAEETLKHVYDELRVNLISHIERQESAAPPADTSIAGLLKGRDWLTTDGNYHIDTSHLASTVRVARVIDDSEQLRLARELCQYGYRTYRSGRH